MDKRKALLGLAILLFCITGMQPVAAGASQGGETYDGTYFDAFTNYPVDIFYDSAITDGYLIFPVYVRAEALRIYVGVLPITPPGYVYWIPSVFKFDIYIQDCTDNAPETVFDLVNYDVLCTAYGTSVSWSYTIGANVGFTSEPIDVGADISATWSFSSTDISSASYSNAHWKTISNNYHLGQVVVDVNEIAKIQEKVACVFHVSVSNHNAPTYMYNHYKLVVRVTVTFQLWLDWLWNWWMQSSTMDKSYDFVYLGDGYPTTTDAMLYLLQASDAGGLSQP